MQTISVPFSINSSGGVASVTTTRKAIEQQILDILTTSSFERVMNPEYGGNVKSLLFEEQDPLVFAEFQMDSLSILNSALTLGKVTSVDVSMPNDVFYGDPNESSVYISVTYIVPPYGTSTVTFTANSLNEITLYGGTNGG